MHVYPRFRSSLPIGAILAAAGMLAAAPALAQDPPGILVTDPTSGVSVTMPVEPQAQEATIPGTDIVIRYYLAVDGETATSFSVFDVTDADGGFDLDGGVNGSAEGTGGSVTASAPIVHQGHAGRDFELAVADPSTGAPGIVLSRLLWTGQNVVQLQAVGRDTDRAHIEDLFADLVATLDLGVQAIASPGASGLPGASAPVAVDDVVAAACAGTTYSRCADGVRTVMEMVPGSLIAVCEYDDGEGDIVLVDSEGEAEAACSGDGLIALSRVRRVVQLP